MNIFERLWQRIVSSNDEQYIIKIKELEAQLKESTEELESVEVQLDHYIDWYEDLKTQFYSLQDIKNELLEELDSLKHKEADYTIPTDIIDTSNWNISGKAIIKDGWVYIVDDYQGTVKMKYSEFEQLIKKFKDVKK
ncbi:MAG: hypothetical protein EOL97_16905 [Spirochaetia bacterium]|nr:hypothetical protein [Spirochaetia bacterium]